MHDLGAREKNQSHFPNLGLGLGLRAPHFNEVLTGTPRVSWFEVISENFMGIAGGTGGMPLEKLVRIREKFPIVMHGVSLNIGSSDPLDLNYLNQLKQLAHFIEPRWVSDHFCWTGVDGKNLHDLMPLPYTKETVNHLCERIQFCQEYLGRRLVFENVSSYIEFKHSEMPEWEFVSDIARRTGCGLLVDVNNIYVSSFNHGYDPLKYLRAIPIENVAQIHLAGHSTAGSILIDTHDHPVSPEVWQLYGEAIKIFGDVSTMIERDDHIPDYLTLENEILLAEAYLIKNRHPLTANHKDSLYERIAFT
jgi:uncharacterized protein